MLQSRLKLTLIPCNNKIENSSEKLFGLRCNVKILVWWAHWIFLGCNHRLIRIFRAKTSNVWLHNRNTSTSRETSRVGSLFGVWVRVKSMPADVYFGPWFYDPLLFLMSGNRCFSKIVRVIILPHDAYAIFARRSVTNSSFKLRRWRRLGIARRKTQTVLLPS